MNLKGIFKILNYVVGIEGIFLLLPALVGVIFKQYHAALVYFAVAAVCIVVAALFIFIQRHDPTKRGFYGKEGFVATALSWFILSLIGAVPMYLTGDIPNYVDALFECTSGYTTTGASVIPNLSVISLPTIFFRSFTHWIGGMGVLVFILAILPMSGGSPLSIMKAESPGPSVSKMVPKLQRTAMISYGIYIALTVLEFVLLLFDPDMPVFENICHTMGTAGTGGFSVTNSGPAGYSSYVNVVTTVFMMLFGANFSFYFLLITKKFRDAFGLEEIRWYVGIFLFAVLIIFLNLHFSGFDARENLLGIFYSCASLMTTTGYTIVDFGKWPVFTHVVLMTLMFVGGCAGSTGGGFKVSRIMLMLKQVGKEVRQQIHPNQVYSIRVDKKPVSADVLKSCNIIFISYVMILIASCLLVSLDDFDFTTTFSGVLATYDNIGVGFGKVCVGGCFNIFSWHSKLVMVLDMIAGRLEILPVLLLFHPATWKK